MKKNKILGLLLILISLFINFYDYLIIKTKEEKMVTETNKYITETSINNTTITDNIKTEDNSKYDYVAILEIPDINIKKGLLSIDNKYNDIAYNIAIMETSQMPDIKNSNLILASHNGNSPVSFFKDLEKLNTDSIIYIYYNGYKYTYKINNYYIVNKTGKINISRDKTKNTITLITCKNNSDTEQIVYIGYMIDREVY